MKLHIKNAPPTITEYNIINKLYSNHNHFHQGDSGIDLYCPNKVLIKPGETKFINLGIKCQAFSDTGVPCSYYMYPRSSISKTPLRLANSVGIIDRDYRGNLIAVFDNIKDYNYTIEEGDRLVQICAPDLGSIHMELVDELSDLGTRGEGGFGSTGR